LGKAAPWSVGTDEDDAIVWMAVIIGDGEPPTVIKRIVLIAFRTDTTN